MPAGRSAGKSSTRSRRKVVPDSVLDPGKDAGKAEREFQRDADVILAFLSDGLPHTRAEVGEHAQKHGINAARLGAIKRRMSIAHVRVQRGSENGLGRSVFAWIIEK